MTLNILCMTNIHGYMDFVSHEIDTGKLLKDYTEKDYEKAYQMTGGRKFDGWRLYQVNDFKIRYVKEIVFVFTNDKGATPIDYKYTLKESKVAKKEFNVTGSIGIKMNGDVKKMKGGLDAELKISNKEFEEVNIMEESKIEVKVDPGYTLSLVIFGEGTVINGVGINYFFWIETERGGYEVFTKTCEYTRLLKSRI